MRCIVLDTETTGLDPDDGHKIIEIGCIEILNRNITNNTFHKYINPNREIDAEASKIHGLTNNFLRDKPLFEEVYSEFREYISDSPLIIHNAPFDIGFLKKEHSVVSISDDFMNNEIIDSLKRSDRGEYEITELNKKYLNLSKVNYSIFDSWWIDAGTPERIEELSQKLI